ncbi:MAG: metal ABC transporter ATP-binding protein [Spirochaetes bacterium]|nr:metal ABC transporter ATP-binding protein [Spirochaetota bacterium]
MNSDSKTTAIFIKDVSVSYRDVTVFSHLSATVPRGKITSIIGPNGAGKTSLILAILDLIRYEGIISFYTDRRSVRFAYAPQKLDLPGDATVTVKDLFAVLLQRRPLMFGYEHALQKAKEEHLALVGLNASMFPRKIRSLSGGERQRVMLAASLAQSPDILILDEPVAGVDVAGEKLFEEIITGVHRRFGLTIIMISHDLSTVRRNSHHVLCLNHGIVCEGPPELALNPDTIERLFNKPALYVHHHDGDHE